MLGNFALLTLVGVTYLGALSRFTKGRYTPAFYQYQVDRAPDRDSAKIIPYIDVALGTLLLFHGTRTFSSLCCTIFQGIGVILRWRAEKSAVPDTILLVVAATVFLTSLRHY